MTALLPVQLAALDAARGKRGFGIFLDMGLGKTLVALTEFLALVQAKQVSRLVVICPNSFKSGWAAEISKHRLHLAVHVYNATKHKWADDFVGSHFMQPPVLIVNYDALRLPKMQQLIADYTHNRKVMLVVDESIAIKNPTSKRTRALHKLKYNFAVKRLLTGKPTTQGVHDLWAQLYLIDAAQKMTFYAFRNRFCQMGGWENRQVTGVKNTAELRALLASVSFEAKKKDWLPGLPEKSYTTRSYELTDILDAHYREMEQEFMTWIEENHTEVLAEIALTKYMKLQQIMAGFIHDNDGEPEWLVPNEHNPRLKLLLEVLDEIDSKVCIVYRHKFVGEQLQQVLRHLTPALISGGMTPDQIMQEKDYFNTRPNCRAILLQVDAAKYGHTLVGSENDPCFTMIFYENTYSLDTRSQIEDRIHRIGQANACLYLDLIGTDMDRRVIRALQAKERVYQALFGEKKEAA